MGEIILLKIFFNKGDWWKVIINSNNNGRINSNKYLVLINITCIYIIYPNTRFNIEYSDGVRVVSFRIKNTSQYFRAKAYIKLSKLVLCPILILHDTFNFGTIRRVKHLITPFPLKVNAVKIVFRMQLSTHGL